VDRVVVDASVVVELLVDPPFAESVREAVGAPNLLAPDLVNAEVLHTLRRFERSGELTTSAANECVLELRRAPIRRIATTRLIEAAWSLRGNHSAYDAVYLALAAQLRCALITRDRRLAASPAVAIPVVVL
jgi:predicted nucleic acid-binding protein